MTPLKKFKSRKWAILVVCGIAAVLYIKYSSKIRTPMKTLDTYNQFSDLNMWKVCPSPGKCSKTYFVLHNFCFEKDAKNSTIMAVYGASRDQIVNVVPSSGPYVHGRKWPLALRKQPIPSHYARVTNQTIFFVSLSCEGNLHHFWTDTASGLYGAMLALNKLNSSVPSRVFYERDPWTASTVSGCHGIVRYQDFLKAFGIGQHVYYKQGPVNTCFQDAVFGYYTKDIKHGDMINYLYHQMGINGESCPHPMVTIQQRLARKILNAEDIKQALIKERINTQIVVFDKLSLSQQLQVIACTDVFVGIQGAGLAWIYFLKNPRKSGLLELAWVDKHWCFRYKDRAKARHIHALTQNAAKVELDFDMFIKKERGGKMVSEKEKHRLLNTKPRNQKDDDVWKWANGEFDVPKVVSNVKSLYKKIGLTL